MPYSKISKKNHERGFTVIELLVVIVILAILGAISVGPMLRWRANAQVESNAGIISSDLERAKVEAIRSSRNVSITFPTGHANYDYYCYIDINGNRKFEPASGDKLLFGRQHNTLLNLNLVLTNSSGTLPKLDEEAGFTFTPRGFLSRTGMGKIAISSTNAAADVESEININRIGNISTTTTRK